MEDKSSRCWIRCLEEEDVRQAKERLAQSAYTKIPYLCKLSGRREEGPLVSDERIRELAAIFRPLGDPLARRILFALVFSELYECGIANGQSLSGSHQQSWWFCRVTT